MNASHCAQLTIARSITGSRRTGVKSKLKAAFESEMVLAVHCIRAGRLEQAMWHLERAHVLGQSNVMPHVRSHWHMFRIALRRHAYGEGLGQVVRIILGALGSAVRIIPVGNTGGSNISMFARIPIDPELAELIKQDRDGH
jgi:hypothetical protein